MGETSDEKEEDVESEEEYYRVLCKLALIIEKIDESHRNSLFKACYLVGEEMCDVIIGVGVGRILSVVVPWRSGMKDFVSPNALFN